MSNLKNKNSMSNPLFQSGHDTPNNSTVPHNPETEVSVKTKKNRSHFNLNHVVLDTMRYGEYHPFLCMPVVPKDNITLHSKVDVRSDTLASPLMTGISINQDYCYVPLTALMPRTAELALKTPASGDDVPEDAFPSVELSAVIKWFSGINGSVESFWNGLALTTWSNDTFVRALQMLQVASYFYSNGSLLKTLGYSFIAEFSCSLDEQHSRALTFDNVFDLICRDIAGKLASSSKVHRFAVIDPSSSGTSHYVYYANDAASAISTDTSESIFFKSAIEYLKYLLYSLQTGIYLPLTGTDVKEIIPSDYVFPSVSITLPGNPIVSQPEDVVSLSYDRLSFAPLFSYHAMMSTFFVNKNIDKIYSFDLWLANLRAVLYSSSSSVKSFSYNGSVVPYDMTAGIYIKDYLARLEQIYTSSTSSSTFDKMYAVTTILFSFHNVLMYGDRFTNCRVRALGVEDDASILLGDNATAVDVTRSVIYQKFRNKVSKLGNFLNSQLGGFFGVDTPPDYHYPQYIGTSSSSINGIEVANTGENLGEQVTRINSQNVSNKGFNVDITYHGYILGVASFSVPFALSRPMSRDCFFGTRWELYNPDFQNLGDEAIRYPELNGLVPNAAGLQQIDSPFGYEGRDNFYKIPVSKARGSFASQLRSWAFVLDSSNDVVPNVRGIYKHVCPEFLRACPLDFDRFIVNFGNASPGDWYHFILCFTNNVQAERNMIDDPSISLG